MKDGFIRVAAATPEIRVADCVRNAKEITEQIRQACSRQASLVVFPELCVTGYTCSDLFMQKSLIQGAEEAVKEILAQTARLNIMSMIGVPVAYGDALYNCGAVLFKGKLLALIPKTNIPAYSEFYEGRHFTPGENAAIENVMYADQCTTINSRVIFTCENIPELKIACEICEDLWVAQSPSLELALNGGATVVANLSASDDTIGKAEYRRNLVKMQSGKLICAYIFADAGFGESTTDLVFSGQNLICENAALLAESKRFTTGIAYADIDLQRIEGERRRTTTFQSDKNKFNSFKRITFKLPVEKLDIKREFPKLPFVPQSQADLQTRCEEILSMQTAGLATRLSHTGIKDVVLGLSGGLDSTLALIVCVHAFDFLGLPRENIHTVTMPCFGTTARTKSNAQKLAEAYQTDFRVMDITEAVSLHFKDIGHDPAVTDTTYENSQARERTQVLMDLSNQLSALVIGTGDLSELALGWATYNGDQMSMYGVNSSVPKTLVRYLVSYEAAKSSGELKDVLEDILATPVSPELLPPDKDGRIAQKTEDVVGPYELHDFFLYYMIRFGYAPSKIYRLACISFRELYAPAEIKKWLTTFVRRFFTQQFKRSCMPDGPKIGSVTLSPRGDWRMPSDAAARLWLADLDSV